MKLLKIIIDTIIIILLFLIIYISYYNIEYLTLNFLGNSKEEYFTSLINVLVPTATSVIATIFGILIAIYVISMQLIKKTPYSRLVNVLYRKTDIFYFSIFVITLFFPIFIIVTWADIVQSNKLFYIDIIIILYLSSILSLIAIMLKHLSIMEPRIIAERTLSIFNIKNILSYGLTLVEQNTHNSNISYKLRTWEHRHNLIDPLGAFHDLLMESINSRERITFHLYLSVFIKRIAFLNGVTLNRKFGLLQQNDNKLKQTIINFGLLLISTNDISKKIRITVHALHYIVRRAKSMTNEWGIDNHRQIFTINLGDLILSLSNKKDNGEIIEICLYAILRINIDYQKIPLHGSYEPLNDIFNLVLILKEKGFIKESKICIQILSYLDANTKYLSNNKNINLNQIFNDYPPELVDYYKAQILKSKDKEIIDVFEKILWIDKQNG